MKKRILVFCLIILTTFISIKYALWFIDVDQRNRDASGLSLTEDNLVFLSKSKASFHGDGCDYEIYEFDDIETKELVEKVRSSDKWSRYPLDSVSSELVNIWNGFIKNESTSQEELAKSNYTSDIPKIDNGYYLLLDRATYNKSEAILERSSYNFSLFLFDADKNTIYYLILDT